MEKRRQKSRKEEEEEEEENGRNHSREKLLRKGWPRILPEKSLSPHSNRPTDSKV